MYSARWLPANPVIPVMRTRIARQISKRRADAWLPGRAEGGPVGPPSRQDLPTEGLVVAALTEGAEVPFVLVRSVVRWEEVVLRFGIDAGGLDDQDAAREECGRRVVVSRDGVRRDERGRTEADLDPVLRDERDGAIALDQVSSDDRVDVTVHQDPGLLIAVDVVVGDADLGPGGG